MRHFLENKVTKDLKPNEKTLKLNFISHEFSPKICDLGDSILQPFQSDCTTSQDDEPKTSTWKH